MRISDWSSDVCSSDLASALEAQASATDTMARRNASSNFGDFGERSTFGANRSFGAAGGLLSERASGVPGVPAFGMGRSEEHTSELQSLMRTSYAVFCLKTKHKTLIKIQNSRYRTK